MTDEFLRDRVRAVRSIADKADPITENRLLDLAQRYDDRIGKPLRSAIGLATPTILNQDGQPRD